MLYGIGQVPVTPSCRLLHRSEPSCSPPSLPPSLPRTHPPTHPHLSFPSSLPPGNSQLPAATPCATCWRFSPSTTSWPHQASCRSQGRRRLWCACLSG